VIILFHKPDSVGKIKLSRDKKQLYFTDFHKHYQILDELLFYCGESLLNKNNYDSFVILCGEH